MTPFSDLFAAISEDGVGVRAHVPQDWRQGRTTFGGMTAALCVAAAEKMVPDLPPLRSAQFAFVGPAGGDVVMTPSVLRRGKSSVFISVDLAGEAGLATRAILSFGAARESSISYRARPMPAMPAPDDCAPLFRSGQGPVFLQHFAALQAGGGAPISGAAIPQFLLWLKHNDARAMASLPGLIALADAPPPAALAMFRAPAPISTVTWSIDMVDAQAALDDDGWLLMQSLGEDARDGYSSQDMAIWTEAGTLVLLARQVIAIFA